MLEDMKTDLKSYSCSVIQETIQANLPQLIQKQVAHPYQTNPPQVIKTQDQLIPTGNLMPATTNSNRKQKPTQPNTSRGTCKRSQQSSNAPEPAATTNPANQHLQPELPKPNQSIATTNSTSLLTTIPTAFQLNINGISEKSQQYKIIALKEIIQSNENPIPFFIITESHLKTRHFDHEIAIENYTTLRADRPIRLKGGVIIYLHKDLVMDDKEIYSHTICQAAMIYNSKINLIIVGIYRPPRADDKSFQSCLKKVDTFINKHNGADIQMMGDLNFPHINLLGDQGNKQSSAVEI